MSWREIAWNGVRFCAPAAWEAAKIGPRYLLLTDQGEPALEIKWERIKGRFSHRTAFRRLRSPHGDAVQESPLPDPWQRKVVGFTGTGFSWQTQIRRGRGAILYCPTCGNATLIQFFQNFSDPRNETCLRVLSSFQDHRLDNNLCWSIFDIRALIPAEYRLAKYRFEAGMFELNFGSKRQQVTLYRWGPASMLLENGNLLPFVENTFRIQRNEWRSLTSTGHNAVQWEKSVPGSRWVRYRERMTGIPHFQWFRLWHLKEKNRILGVSAKGDRTFHSDLLDRICAEYDSL